MTNGRNDITGAELGLAGYVRFRKHRMGRRGGVLLYIKETIPAYEIQLQERADCKEAIWCKLVTGHTTVTIGVVYRCPNITIQNNEKIHNAISEVSKGDCIIMGDFNHGNGDGYAAVDVVKTAVITGDGAANVCEVVGRCDRLCSDEC